LENLKTINNKQVNHKYMKYNRLISITISIACLLAMSLFKAHAQTPMSLYYLENLPQSNFVNPAMMPRTNAFVGFPLINSIYISHQSDVSMKTFLQEDGNQWVSPLDANYDYDKLYRQIGKCANINENEAISPIIFGFKTHKGYFTFAYSEKLSFNGRIPADLFKIVENGFPDNSQFDLKTLGADVNYYREFSFGYATKVNDALTLGVHVKPLFGLAAMRFDINKLDLNTSLDEWSFDVDGSIYSSFPMDVYSGSDGKPDSLEIRDLKGSEIKKKVTNFSNPGLALDFGAVYELNNQWSFSGSLNNLGFISWKTDLNSVSAKGKYNFNGLDIEVQNLDSIDNAFSDLLDSLTTVVDVQSGHQQFKSYLTPVLTLGAQYQASYTVSFGFISQSFFQKYNFRQNFNLSTNINFYHFLTASANYNISVKGVNSFGFGLAFKGGPFQLYVLADHIPTRYTKVEDGSSSYLVPSTTKEFNVMMGLNILFGGKGFRDEPMIGL